MRRLPPVRAARRRGLLQSVGACWVARLASQRPQGSGAVAATQLCDVAQGCAGRAWSAEGPFQLGPLAGRPAPRPRGEPTWRAGKPSALLPRAPRSNSCGARAGRSAEPRPAAAATDSRLGNRFSCVGHRACNCTRQDSPWPHARALNLSHCVFRHRARPAGDSAPSLLFRALPVHVPRPPRDVTSFETFAPRSWSARKQSCRDHPRSHCPLTRRSESSRRTRSARAGRSPADPRCC